MNWERPKVYAVKHKDENNITYYGSRYRQPFRNRN